MSHRPASSVSTPHPPIAPTAPAAVHALAVPPPVLVDASLPAYLLPATLRALADSATYAIRKRQVAEREAEGFGADEANGTGVDHDNENITRSKGGSGRKTPKLIEDAVHQRLERIGQYVGGYIAEKLTLARAPLATHLDMIKFICKDLFLYVYGQQIDNLRTNHRGVFVLQSQVFPPLAPLSSYHGSAADLEVARQHLVFPQALIQGALLRLGMHATVHAECAQLPQCTFHIRTVKHSTTGGAPPRRESMGATSALAQ